MRNREPVQSISPTPFHRPSGCGKRQLCDLPCYSFGIVRILSFAALLFVAILAGYGQAATDSGPGLPKNPREVFAEAAPFYDFSDPGLKPWHLKMWSIRWGLKANAILTGKGNGVCGCPATPPIANLFVTQLAHSPVSPSEVRPWDHCEFLPRGVIAGTLQLSGGHATGTARCFWRDLSIALLPAPRHDRRVASRM